MTGSDPKDGDQNKDDQNDFAGLDLEGIDFPTGDGSPASGEPPPVPPFGSGSEVDPLGDLNLAVLPGFSLPNEPVQGENAILMATDEVPPELPAFDAPLEAPLGGEVPSPDEESPPPPPPISGEELSLEGAPLHDPAPEPAVPPPPPAALAVAAADLGQPAPPPLDSGHPLSRGKDVPAALPFSLLIDGKLAPEDREKLVNLLAREKMGIREVDLEPQFESGRVLIPRISEYAGILLVQALRNTGAKMRLAPSDQIFATAETREGVALHQPPTAWVQVETPPPALGPYGTVDGAAIGATFGHPAEQLPITQEGFLPQLGRFAVIDSLTASATLTSRAVEVEDSGEYQEILEGLKRKLKYTAYRKGAAGLVSFRASLTQLGSPANYRVMLTATAVKAAPALPGLDLPTEDGEIGAKMPGADPELPS